MRFIRSTRSSGNGECRDEVTSIDGQTAVTFCLSGSYRYVPDGVMGLPLVLNLRGVYAPNANKLL
jgi:hypothetical protein